MGKRAAIRKHVHSFLEDWDIQAGSFRVKLNTTIYLYIYVKFCFFWLQLYLLQCPQWCIVQFNKKKGKAPLYIRNIMP